MRTFFQHLATVMVSVAVFATQAHAEETEIPLDKVPKKAIEAVKKMFPKAELVKASQETEDGKIEYEVTVKNDGKIIEVDVDAEGKIDGLEKEIDLKELPKAVTEALAKKYPKSTPKSAEAVFEIEDGKEEFEYYEVELKTEDGKEVEVKIKADGTIVTDD